MHYYIHIFSENSYWVPRNGKFFLLQGTTHKTYTEIECNEHTFIQLVPTSIRLCFVTLNGMSVDKTPYELYSGECELPA